jgi:hypothetical protein
MTDSDLPDTATASHGAMNPKLPKDQTPPAEKTSDIDKVRRAAEGIDLLVAKLRAASNRDVYQNRQRRVLDFALLGDAIGFCGGPEFRSK